MGYVLCSFLLLDWRWSANFMFFFIIIIRNGSLVWEHDKLMIPFTTFVYYFHYHFITINHFFFHFHTFYFPNCFCQASGFCFGFLYKTSIICILSFPNSFSPSILSSTTPCRWHSFCKVGPIQEPVFFPFLVRAQ